MARISIFNIGAAGIVRDIPPHLLPPEAWSDGQNVRFKDNKVQKFTGEALIFDPPTVPPYWALAVQGPANVLWLYAGLTKIYTVDAGGTHFNITRQSVGTDVDYTGNAGDKWNGGLLGGIPVLTNGVDVPQSWNPAATSQRLVDLPNWDATKLAKYIVPFKSYLVALNITESGTVKPHKVLWSHPADPGTVPMSWDITDPTKDAGDVELTDAQSGVIRDALQLRDNLIIYNDNSIWGMQFVGGTFIFRFFKIFDQSGILAHNCVGLLPKKAQHFVATGDDLVVHDGQTMQSVVDKSWRRFIDAHINPDQLDNSFVVTNPLQDEQWFCFPEVGSTLPSLAVVWNTKDNTVGARDLSSTDFIALGVLDVAQATQTWDGSTSSWSGAGFPWDGRGFAPQSLGLLKLDSTNTQLLQMDTTNQLNGINMSSFIERQGLALVGRDRQNNPKTDMTKRKLLTRIWIEAEGGPFTVQAGAQEDLNANVVYDAGQTFTPGTDSYVDVTANGRFLAVKFSSNTDVTWQLHSYDLEVSVMGEN